MKDAEVVHRYAMMGLTAYIEEQIKDFEREHLKKPALVLLGELEWVAIMDAAAVDEFSVAGVNAVPDPTLHRGVRLVP